MWQYWKIVNIDKRQQLENNHGGIKLQELISNGVPKPMVDLLKVPQLRVYRIGEGFVAAAHAKSTSSRLVGLPQELIDAVLRFVPVGLDSISLALTCSYFFRLLLTELLQTVIADEAPWAGDRLATVGDYAAGVPITVSETEVQEMLTATSSSMNPDDEYTDDEVKRNPLYHTEWTKVSNKMGTYEEAEWLCSDLDGNQAAWQWRLYWSGQTRRVRQHRLGASDMQLLDRLLRHPNPKDDDQFVLRCLDRKEFIRDPAVLRAEERLEMDGYDEYDTEYEEAYQKRMAEEGLMYGFGEALCLLTTWTIDGPGIRPWAGCRFDITVKQHVDRTWTDISGDVLELFHVL